MVQVPGFKLTQVSINELGSSQSEKVNFEKSRILKPQESGGNSKFSEMLKDSISDVNQAQKSADKMATDLATGKNLDIHETMLAVSQAELTFNLMVQVRNKALEAYQEIMRMPV